MDAADIVALVRDAFNAEAVRWHQKPRELIDRSRGDVTREIFYDVFRADLAPDTGTAVMIDNSLIVYQGQTAAQAAAIIAGAGWGAAIKALQKAMEPT